MKIKMTTLLKTEFGVKNPHKLLRDLKQIGNLSPKSLRKVFEDTPKERFDIEIVKKYVDYVYNHPNKTQLYYTPEYWMYRKNISYEEAVELVAQQKRDKSPSKEGYIKRYGEEKGLKLFEEFQKISSYSSSDEWFKEKYGDDWENKKIISNLVKNIKPENIENLKRFNSNGYEIASKNRIIKRKERDQKYIKEVMLLSSHKNNMILTKK